MRYSRPTHAAAVVCLFLTTVISASSAADQPAQPAHLVKVTKTTTDKVAVPATPIVQKVAPAGSALYIAKRGESVISVARHFLPQTSYLTSSQVTEAIRGANDDVRGTFLKQGQNVIVPGILAGTHC